MQKEREERHGELLGAALDQGTHTPPSNHSIQEEFALQKVLQISCSWLCRGALKGGGLRRLWCAL